MTNDMGFPEKRRKRLSFRAWHRGTKEADLIFGHFVDRFASGFSEADMDWLESLLTERELDILDWIYGRAAVPPAYDTPLFHRIQKLDFIPPARP